MQNTDQNTQSGQRPPVTAAKYLHSVIRNLPCNVLLEATALACRQLGIADQDAGSDHPDMVLDAAATLDRHLGEPGAIERLVGRSLRYANAADGSMPQDHAGAWVLRGELANRAATLDAKLALRDWSATP